MKRLTGDSPAADFPEVWFPDEPALDFDAHVNKHVYLAIQAYLADARVMLIQERGKLYFHVYTSDWFNVDVPLDDCFPDTEDLEALAKWVTESLEKRS